MLGGMFVGLSVEAPWSSAFAGITLGAATVHDAHKDGALMLELGGSPAVDGGQLLPHGWL